MRLLVEALYVLVLSFIVGILAGYGGHPWTVIVISSLLIAAGFLKLDKVLDKGGDE